MSNEILTVTLFCSGGYDPPLLSETIYLCGFRRNQVSTRYIGNSAIFAKIESSYGSDPIPTKDDNAILVSNLTLNLNYNNVDRNLIKGYFGASEQLVGTRFVEISFDVEIAGSGTADAPPPWACLLFACGTAGTAVTAHCYKFELLTRDLPSLTIYYFLDGIRYKINGCRGNAEFKMNVGERPTISFKFVGIPGNTSATAIPSLTFTNWTKPLVMTLANSGKVKLGSDIAFNPNTPGFTGGEFYFSKGISFTIGNDVKFIPTIGEELVEISQREVTGSLSLKLDAADNGAVLGEMGIKNLVESNTTTKFAFKHGVEGNRIFIYSPSVQLLNMKHEDLEGILLITVDLRFIPIAGNDEILIATG